MSEKSAKYWQGKIDRALKMAGDGSRPSAVNGSITILLAVIAETQAAQVEETRRLATALEGLNESIGAQVFGGGMTY